MTITRWIDDEGKTRLRFKEEPKTDDLINSRYENLIAFVAPRTSHAEREELILDTAWGLSEMGANVLVVNVKKYPSHGRKVPQQISSSENGSIHAWNDAEIDSNYRMTRHYEKFLSGPVNAIGKLCKEFDYVLVQGRDEENSLMVAKSSRFIYDGTQKTSSVPFLADRSYIVLTHNESVTLWINDMGVPESLAIVRAFGCTFEKDIVPKGVELPVIAVHHPRVNKVELAKAVIGTGDPLYFYSPVENMQKDIKKQQILQDPKIRDRAEMAAGLTFSLGSVTLGVLGGILDFDVSNLLGIALGLQTLATVPLVKFHRMKSTMRKYQTDYPELLIKSRKDKNIVPETVKSSFAIQAPPLGISPAHKEGISESIDNFVADLVTNVTKAWTQAEKIYLDTRNQWLEYELDIMKTLDAPLMTDYACPQTAALAKAVFLANTKHAEAQDDPQSKETRDAFYQAVNELVIAFRNAETHALKQGITYLTDKEQTHVSKAKTLLTLAFDDGASTSERDVAYTQALRNLDGILRITPQMSQRIIESASIQKSVLSKQND